MRIASIDVRPLTKALFAPFGDVIETEGAELRLINNGTTERYHDLANVDVTGAGCAGAGQYLPGQGFWAPIDIAMLERHPLGSQAFMPLQNRPFLAVVAEDEEGGPDTPSPFCAREIRASTMAAMSGITR